MITVQSISSKKFPKIMVVASVLWILVAMTACVFPSPEFPDEIIWSGTQGELWRIGSESGDYELYFSTGEDIWLVANVYGLDHDELLQKYEVSEDGKYLLLLIADSGRNAYPFGTCLSVFDLDTPQAHLYWNRAYGWALCPVMQVVHVEVLEAAVFNDKVEYTTSEEFVEYPL
jgi:hypothetical protein